MEFLKKPRFYVLAAVTLAALYLLKLVWDWEVERVEVPAERYLVRIHRWGRDLEKGQIIAPDESYKGVMLDVLPEGRHFLNPLFWGYEIHDLVHVGPDECLVLTRLYGAPIPAERLAQGNFLAGDGEQGIVREPLRAGSYRLNPYAYAWEKVKAVQVAINQVGVRTLKVGKDVRELPPDPKRSRYVVPAGYRGVQEKPETSGVYYLNPYVETITPVEAGRSHKVELTDMEFPSRDGFILKPHVLVEYAVIPDRAPELLVRLTDEGILHQEDSTPQEQQQNEVLQKIILPYILGYARIEGSNFDARDFIGTPTAAGTKPDQRAVNSRESLQRALLAKVKPRCAEYGIDLRAVTLATMPPPPELVKQITERELALREQERNKTMLGQLKAEQELKAREARKLQNKEKVEAETLLRQEKINASRLKEVEESRLRTELANAQVKLDAARKQAEAVLTTGKTEAAIIHLQNEAEVAGLRKAIQGFTSASHFAQYQMLSRLGPALSEIFASDDSEFAKVFSNYMTAPALPGSGRPAITGDRPGTTTTGTGGPRKD